MPNYKAPNPCRVTFDVWSRLGSEAEGVEIPRHLDRAAKSGFGFLRQRVRIGESARPDVGEDEALQSWEGQRGRPKEEATKVSIGPGRRCPCPYSWRYSPECMKAFLELRHDGVLRRSPVSHSANFASWVCYEVRSLLGFVTVTVTL